MGKKASPRKYEGNRKQMGTWLTEIAIDGLEKLAERYGVSRNELLEMIGRGHFQLDLLLPESE